jgi:hypothetical protein
MCTITQMRINRRRKKLLSEIHEGICGTHPGARTMARKLFHLGFYWPSAQNDNK